MAPSCYRLCHFTAISTNDVCLGHMYCCAILHYLVFIIIFLPESSSCYEIVRAKKLLELLLTTFYQTEEDRLQINIGMKIIKFMAAI